MRDRRRTPMLPPSTERPDVLETMRGFFLRPLDALLRGGSSQPDPAAPPDDALATGTPAGLMELWRRGTSVWTPSPPSPPVDSGTATYGPPTLPAGPSTVAYSSAALEATAPP